MIFLFKYLQDKNTMPIVKTFTVGKKTMIIVNGNKWSGGIKCDIPNLGVYRGFLLNGLFHGEGTLLYLSGDKYEGNWKHGLQYGYGALIKKNGIKFSGIWKNGKLQSDNVVINYCDDNKYTGSVKNGKPDGFGTFYNYDKSWWYEGQWEDGMMHGLGKFGKSGQPLLFCGWEKNQPVEVKDQVKYHSYIN